MAAMAWGVPPLMVMSAIRKYAGCNSSEGTA